MQHLLFNTFKKFNYPSMILKHISFFLINEYASLKHLISGKVLFFIKSNLHSELWCENNCIRLHVNMKGYTLHVYLTTGPHRCQSL